MIGIIVLADLKDPQWNWKLLHKFHNTTPLTHLTQELAKVEHSHKNIVSFTHAERPHITGSLFSDSVWTTTNHTHFSLRKTRIGRIHDVCIAHGLDAAVIVNGEDWLTPAYIIKALIMKSFGGRSAVQTTDFPVGIGATLLPFYEIANMYRYEGHPEESDNMERLQQNTLVLANTYFKTNLNLRLSEKSQIPTFDMILKGLETTDLGDILEDISELQQSDWESLQSSKYQSAQRANGW